MATIGATANFEEIRSLVSSLPGPDQQAAGQVRDRERELTKPPGALGRLEDLAEWLATWQGCHPPRVGRARVAVFAGNHGVAKHGVSAYPSTVTAQMVKNFQTGGAAVNQLCALMDAELNVYEMALDQPTGDILSEPAMSEEECARSISYGMMAVEDGLDAICLGEMGIANTTSAAALCLALFGGTAHDWTGPGTGVAGSQLALKTSVVAEAVKLHAPFLEDPLETLRHLGGHELAAIVGAIIAARMARVPVILDGYALDSGGGCRSQTSGRRARPCRRRPPIGRTRTCPVARTDWETADSRSWHAPRRGVWCRACALSFACRRCLPQRYGNVCRGGSQRKNLMSDHSPICSNKPRCRATRNE